MGDVCQIIYPSQKGLNLNEEAGQIKIRANLGPLDVSHVLALPAVRPHLDETFTFQNVSADAIRLEDLVCSFQRVVTNRIGEILPDLSSDVVTAIPFRHRSEDPIEIDNEFTLSQH